MPKGGKSKGKEVVIKRVGPKASSHRGGNAAGNKERLRQMRKALREKKTRVVLQNQRLGTGLNPPRIVGLMGGNESSNAEALHHAMAKHCEFDPNAQFPTTIGTPTKHRFTFVVESTLTEQRSLDVAKIADIILLAFDCSPQAQEVIAANARIQPVSRSQEDEDDAVDDDDDQGFEVGTARTYFDNIGLCITQYTRNLLRLINAQGCPTFVVALQGLEGCDAAHIRRVHRLHERYFKSMLSEETVVLVENVPNIMRTLETIKVRRLPWRDQHPYFVVEEGDYNETTRVATLSGYLRGSNLSAQMLMHITNHGTFQIQKITADGDPCTMGDAEPLGELDVADDDAREPLERWRVNETAFNDEQDLRGFESAAVAEPTIKVRVPEGTSEYQAAWYTTDELLAGEEDEDRVSEFPRGDDARSYAGMTHQTDIDDVKLLDIIGDDNKTPAQRAEELQRLREESHDDRRHPDEKDTPIHMPARQRFAKFRGMKSFSRGKWDPAENLPIEFARIFTLKGYGKIRDEAVGELVHNPVAVGTYVTVHLENVPPEMWANADDILILSGQIRHEQKWSLLHCHLQRDSDHTEAVKSKTPMMIHVGFRKFFSQPIYSDVATGDRTRYARYFHADEKFRLASFYGPISYHPCPVLFFNVPDDEAGGPAEVLSAPRFFAYGSMIPPNPNFIILKRIVLTGRIAVIYKKQVVVKFMFYNDDDVRWYQPLDLYTRLGRRGKILKPLGEHGLFKAQFNDTVMQHDIVCLDLFKRVFPKWKTVELNVAELLGPGTGESDDDGEVAAEDD